MGQLSKETWIVINEFQKHLKGKDSIVEKFSLEEIRKADENMGARDESKSFRLAMKNRIQELQQTAERKRQSHIRAWVLFTTVLVGLLVGAILKWMR